MRGTLYDIHAAVEIYYLHFEHHHAHLKFTTRRLKSHHPFQLLIILPLLVLVPIIVIVRVYGLAPDEAAHHFVRMRAVDASRAGVLHAIASLRGL